MRKTAAAFAVLAVCLLLTLSGCTQSGPRCSPPYMEYGSMGYCCLDANQNGLCDKYEKGASNASAQGEGDGASTSKTTLTTAP